LPEEFLDATGAFLELFTIILPLVVVMMMVFAPVFSIFAKSNHPEKGDQRHPHEDAEHD
jgi:hypothetical protein